MSDSPSHPTLRGDPLNRKWVQATWGESTAATDIARTQLVIGTLLGRNEDGTLSVLGATFIIHAAGATALCLGAAHSFDGTKRLQQRRSGRGGSAQIAPDFAYRGPEYFTTDPIQVLFMVDGEPLVCGVGQYQAMGEYDVAVFTVHASEGRTPFNEHLALNLGMPQVGDEVAIVAHRIEIEPQPTSADAMPLGILRRTLELRVGTVTEVSNIDEKGPLGQYFTFYTSIPVFGGMSGGPVLVSNGGRSLVAMGVVSSDFSEEASFSSFLVPGRSAASVLWPSMALAVDAEMNDVRKPAAFLGELLHQGAFDDRSDQISVSISQSGEMAELLYEDRRNAHAPVRIHLSVPGHPGRGAKG